MKLLYNFMKLLLCSIPFLFIAYGIYVRCYYFSHPEVYAVESAPWYTALILAGIIAVIAAVIISVVILMIRRKMK